MEVQKYLQTISPQNPGATPGTSEWSRYVAASSYKRRRNPKYVTPQEENVAMAKYGNTSQLYDYLNKLVQERQMTGTFGTNWRQKAQAQMTPQQKKEVAAGTPTRVNPITGLPKTGTTTGTNNEKPEVAQLKQKIADIENQIQQKKAILSKAKQARIPVNKPIPADILTSSATEPPTIDTSDIQATVTSAKNKFAQIQQDVQQNVQNYINQLKTQGQNEQTWLKKAVTSWKGTTAKAPDQQALYEDTLKKYGVTPDTFQKQQDLINQIEAKNVAMTQIDQKYAAKKAELQKMGMPDDYITHKGQYYDRLAAIEKAGIAAEASALAAQYQAINGNINMARSLADKVIQYATMKYQQNINDFKTSFNLKSDAFNVMNKNERAIWDLAYQWNQNQLKLKQTQLTDVMNLMIKYPGAGISVNDTPEEAATKVKSYEVTNPATPKSQTELTPSILRKALAYQIPQDVTEGVWNDLQNGFTLEQIRQNLAKQFGRDKGYSYLDTLMPIFQGTTKTESVIPG